MRNNIEFDDLVSYVDTDLNDKLTSTEQEEIYHLLVIACNSARDSGAANCEDDLDYPTIPPLKTGERWIDRIRSLGF